VNDAHNSPKKCGELFFIAFIVFVTAGEDNVDQVIVFQK